MLHSSAAPCCIAIRASRCSMAAFGASMALEPAMRAFGSRTAHEAARALDDLASRSLADSGCSGLDPFELGLPYGLHESGLACPSLGYFTPRAVHGLFDGIASARSALALFSLRAPDGAYAEAWAFEEDFARCMAVRLGSHAFAIASMARALEVRLAISLAAPCSHGRHSQPTRL